MAAICEDVDADAQVRQTESLSIALDMKDASPRIIFQVKSGRLKRQLIGGLTPTVEPSGPDGSGMEEND